MTRNEFAMSMKGKSTYDITPEDVATWYTLFNTLERPYQEKILGVQTKINLGKALCILWEQALIQYCEKGRRKVEIFPGCCLVSNKDPNTPLRKKYRIMVPDGMTRKECVKLINSFDIDF